MPIITEMKEKGNTALGRVPEPVLWLAIVLLSSGGSFGMGYLSGKEAGGGPVVIESRSALAPEEAAVAAPKASALQAAPAAARAVVSVQKEEPAPPSGGGQYVASKSGTKYHLPWCPGAKQMKEENKIYFSSKEEAEAAGYTPAANCKGI